MQVNKNNSSYRRTLTVMEGRDVNSYMVKGFAAAAEKKGWNFCNLKTINSDLIARFDFDDIPLDFVVFRELSRNNYHEIERVMYWLKHNNKLCINANVAGRRMSTSDKHFQQGLFLMDPFLKEYALPTYEAKYKKNVLAYVEAGRVHYPFVLKDRHGTTGKNITLINEPSDLDQIKSFGNLLIEQYIKPECDYRVFVIGGTAVGIMRKKGNPANPGDFKAWSAGRIKGMEQNPAVLAKLADIATRAAAVSRLEYAGIDIIKEARTGKLYLLETNIAAGWPNFVPVTNINIPELVVDWFEDVDDGRKLSISEAVTKYIEARKHYLPPSIQSSYDKILEGEPTAPDSYAKVFANYPNRYLYDAGNLYERLREAYHPNAKKDYSSLVQEIESMPLSWAGNFIGPEVGTLHDGAILSALYLFLLHKTTKM